MKILKFLCIPMMLAACAGQQTAEEPITWSAEWFQCDGRFQCLSVYDAYCQYTAVNSNFVLIYQDWARQQVQGLDELKSCPPVESDKPGAAYCRQNRCVN